MNYNKPHSLGMELIGQGWLGRTPAASRTRSHSSPMPKLARDVSGMRPPRKKVCKDASKNPSIGLSVPSSAGDGTRCIRALGATPEMQSQRRTSLELSLVSNLKRQVMCLEAQLSSLKKQNTVQNAVTTSSFALKDTPSQEFASGGNRSSCTNVASEESLMRPSVSVPEEYFVELAAMQLTNKSLEEEREDAEERFQRVVGEKAILCGQMAAVNAALRAARDEQRATAAELQAALDAANEEQRRRRSLEHQLQACVAGEGQTSPCAMEDVLHEREYYKLQTDRLKVQQGVLVGRAKALEQALAEERAAVGSLECRLCSALEHADQLEDRLRYRTAQQSLLRSNVIGMAACLRKVADGCAAAHKHLSVVCANASGTDATIVNDVMSHLTLWQVDLARYVPLLAAACGWVNSIESSTGIDTPTHFPTTTVEAMPAPPTAADAVPLPPTASVPAPPTAADAVPLPPTASVPAPPTAADAVPLPPTASVPAPPTAADAVPLPPTASVPAPPTAADAVPLPPTASVPVSLPPPPPSLSLQDELSQLNARILSAESSLRKFIENHRVE